MKTLALWSAVLALGFTLAVGDAEAARRLGGGKSSGMQREMTVPQKSVTPAPAPGTPAQNAAPMGSQAQPGMAAQAQPKRSWMGPIAGLAAGLGLAALASHFGFGEGLANMLMIGLLIMVVLAVVGFIMRKRSGAAAHQPAMAGAHGMHYSGNQYGGDSGSRLAPEYPASSAAPAAGATGNIPANFDTEGFLRNAKVNFLRLQAANDAGNLEDIREFTSPEMFAEIKLSFSERGQGTQETDVVSLNAEVLDVIEEASRYVVSVRFNGLIREDKNATPEAFDEIWHMTKPRDGSRGWVLAGIQQVQ